MFQEFIGVDFWSALAVLINTLLIYFVGKRYLFGPIKAIMDGRQKEIDDMYADADQAKAKAQELQAEYENHLREARVEAAAITSRAVESAKRQGEELVKAAEAETVALREKAAKDIALERRKAMNEAKGEISSLAVELASKVAKKEINQKDHEKLFEQFIDELGEKL